MKTKLLTPVALLFVLAACDRGPTENTETPAVTAKRGCGPTLLSDAAWYSSGATQQLFQGLDGLNHPISMDPSLALTRRDSIQRYFDQGLVMAYGFNHAEAARSFWQVTRMDSTCAMGWWGFAYVLGPNYNAGMEPDNYARAYEAILKANTLKGGCTAKEKGLIDAMALRYAKEAPEDRAPLDRAYSDAMRALAERFPDDADVAALFAESLMDQHPWDLWEKDGREKPWTPEILAALERSMENFPTHFGAHHLYIHAVEASRDPDRALASARFLEDAVPGSGHLVHMPSHIYIRDGRYHEGVLANQRSVSVDSSYTAGCHAAGIYPIAYFPHNIHFLSACASFSGDADLAWRSALDLRDALAADLMTVPDFSTLQHFHAFPWMVATKLELWDALAAEPAPDSAMTYASALWNYAQGMRHARSGDAASARKKLAALRSALADSSMQEMTIWGINHATGVLRVAENDLEGELLLAEGKIEEAIARLTDAVAYEDSLQYQEPPDWCFPARHELGAALLKAGRHAEAEATYRADLIHWPENRFALEGLRAALNAQGRSKEADALGDRIEQAGQHVQSSTLAMRRSATN